MTDLNIGHFEQIVAACTENRVAIAESLNLCLGLRYRIEAGETTLWDPAAVADDLQAPGLAISLQVGRTSLLCAIPESLPLPDWYRTPGEGENSRLQTLAMEWSLNLLPPQLEAGEFRTESAGRLDDFIAARKPSEECGQIVLNLYAAGDPDTSQPAGRIYLVGPLGNPSFADRAPVDRRRGAEEAAAGRSALPQRHDRRLLSLPVTVSVRLAERKIEMGQLLAITPGALITFNKSCEDLLDLYVNNQPYCRGEAVKIGEKFGLKVNQVGFHEERPQRIL